MPPTVRQSARFPNLSSKLWIRLRQNRREAHRVYQWYAERLRPLSVYEGLTCRQRVELTALVAVLHNEWQNYWGDRHVRTAASFLKKHGASRSRKITAKLGAVAKALEALAEVVEFENQTISEALRGALSDRPSDTIIPEAADLRAEVERYRRMTPGNSTEWASRRREIEFEDGEERAVIDEPGYFDAATPTREQFRTRETDISARLQNFFIYECHCSREHAQFDAQLIGEKLFGWQKIERESARSRRRRRPGR